MDAWNNVLDEHCDITVICMDRIVFLMYVCCHGWSYVLDTSYVCCACENISLLLMEQLVVSLPGFFSSHHFRPVFFVG